MRCVGALAFLLLASCVESTPPMPAKVTAAKAPTAPEPVKTAEAPPPKAEAPSGPETPDAPFRSIMPPEDGELTFKPPKVETFKLKNGIKVSLVERHDLPVVTVRVAFRGGSGDYPTIPPGVGSAVAAMMEQGTSTRDALQISEEFEAIGASHSVFVSFDAAGGTLKVLSRQVDRALSAMFDVMQRANFPEAELERLRKRRLTAIGAERGSAEASSQNTAIAALYGRNHPYGHSQGGRAEDVKKWTREDLLKAYQLLFNPKNAVIVVAGDITRPALAAKLEKTFGGWQAPPKSVNVPPHYPERPTTASQSRLFWVDRPGAVQSQLHVIDVGLAENSPDRIPAMVMNTIFGGSFGHIEMNLRETHAYTYSAKSRFERRHGPGPVSINTAVSSPSTAQAIQEIFREVNRMRDEDVKAEELANAKELIKQNIFSQFDTMDGLTGALVNLAVYDRPADELATLGKRIDAVTVEDVRRVAQKYLRSESMKVVVVGDKAKLHDSVSQALKSGPAETRDPSGDPMK